MREATESDGSLLKELVETFARVSRGDFSVQLVEFSCSDTKSIRRLNVEEIEVHLSRICFFERHALTVFSFSRKK